MNGLHLFDANETIKWLRLRRIELRRELRKLGSGRAEGWQTTPVYLKSIMRERFLKRAIRSATHKLDVLQGKKKA